MMESDYLEIASQLMAQHHLPAPRAVTPLSGGRNNRVFRVDTDNFPLLLKSYSRDPRDRRDRLGAEWALLQHAAASGIDAVAKPVARDEQKKIALMSFLRGEKLGKVAITEMHICQAADFVIALNRSVSLDHFSAASEACFSYQDHIEAIEARVDRLETIDSSAPFSQNAQAFVLGVLKPAWQAVKAKLPVSSQPFEKYVLSPSDFGFHNVLEEQGRLFFFDFEYAGIDDPAKLVCDFFCCPQIPAPLAFRHAFAESLTQALNLDGDFLARCDLLLNAYRVKWACIILNDFLAVGDSRRAFATQEGREQRCAQQLEKAEAKLAEIGAK